MLLKKLYITLIYFVWFLKICISAKILAVFSIPSISHHFVFRPLIFELVKRGHEVFVVTTDPAFSKDHPVKNLTEIDIHDISYEIWNKNYVKLSAGKQNDVFNQIAPALDLILKMFIKQIESEKVKELIFSKDHRFDLVFSDASCRPALALSHIIKAPFIQLSSFRSFFGLYENMGAPSHPLLYPTFTRQKFKNLTLWDKISELLTDFYLQNDYSKKEKNESALLRHVFGMDMPDIKVLAKNVDMLFLNSNPIFENNRPIPPNIIYMWGINNSIAKKLPVDLKTILDKAQNGVIYTSFGTNVNTKMLPKEKVNDMIKVFSKLPYQILWKWDDDELVGKSDNIIISKWFPQPDLLKHPKVKLFITHGGLQSTYEAINAGVPLVGIPLIVDQWNNVEKYVSHHIGVRLDIENLSQNTFQAAIETVLFDDRYKSKIDTLKVILEDQPQSSLERAVWWTEYVIKHQGAKHLLTPAASISWSTYIELELVLLLIIILLIFIYMLHLVVKFLFKYLMKMKVIFKTKTK